MRPEGRPGELFAAFSRINARAFRDDRLVSCPVLSKAPDCGDVLRRFLAPATRRPRSPAFWLKCALRYAAANLGHLAFMLCAALFIRFLRFKMPATSEGKGQGGDGETLILDTFAVLPALAEDGAYRELYLVGLEESARAAGHEVLTLFRFYGSRDPRLLRKALGVLSRKAGAMTEIHLLTCTDWARLLLHTLLYPFSLLRLVRSLREYPPSSPEACIREALIDCAGQCVLVGESRRLAARRLAFLLSRESSPDLRRARVISWYENQTVNKAFQRGLAGAEAEGARRVHVTGAQLFIWPGNLLNNHADDVEAELGLAPDCVLVNGPCFLPEHSRQDYAVGPALRYAGVFRPRPCPAGSGPVLVLLSYHTEETERVLRLLRAAGRENPEAFVYRFHPATRPGDFASLLPPEPRLSAGSLRDALDAAGAIIGAGSGAVVEAAATGIPVLAVEDPSGIAGLGLNYLPDFGKGELWESVRAPCDVPRALDRLRAELPDRPEKVRAFRDMLFCEATPERIRESFRL
ncbi:MAG: hypothetical protein LBQ51_09375 [Desulfovibrio sp.]|jgi:hypothetical protein|nr:hypothetical protein [Desulfovibrio sp.]